MEEIFGRELTAGKFGKIYLMNDNNIVKVQILPQNIYEMQILIKERSIHETLYLWQKEHGIEIVPEYIDSGFQLINDKIHFFIIMKKYDGTLRDFDMSNINIDIKNQLQRKLKYIHNIGYVHRDIKPSNIFWRKDVSGQYIFVYGDFGLAKELTIDLKKKDQHDLLQLCTSLLTKTPISTPIQLKSSKTNFLLCTADSKF